MLVVNFDTSCQNSALPLHRKPIKKLYEYDGCYYFGRVDFGAGRGGLFDVGELCSFVRCRELQIERIVAWGAANICE